MYIQKIIKKTNIPKKQILSAIKKVRRAMVPISKEIEITEAGKAHKFIVTRLGVGPLKTDYGCYYFFDFHITDSYEKYSVLVMSTLNRSFKPIFKNLGSVFIRIDSGCETGIVFGDQTCECQEQLQLAMSQVQKAGEGIIIHIPKHEGRGMGLPFKLATLSLESELGLDTIESAYILAPDGIIETRAFGGVICILKFLGISIKSELCLATNNPLKPHIFLENGYKLSPFIPVVIPANEHTKKHLLAKQTNLGHINVLSETIIG
jgi:GTP cyclohydrolase II